MCEGDFALIASGDAGLNFRIAATSAYWPIRGTQAFLITNSPKCFLADMDEEALFRTNACISCTSMV